MTTILAASAEARIREMTIDDLPVVFHLGEALFTADYAPSLYRTWDEYEITTLFNADSELCLVAEGDDGLHGFSLGTTVKKSRSSWKYGYLVWLGVREDQQKSGVGARLFREMKKRLRDQGARMILVDTAADNIKAINFFRKEGFDNLQEHVYLTLNLSRRHKKAVKRGRNGEPKDR